MGWESHIVRSELSDLQFNDRQTSGTASAKSSVLVEFHTLCFRVLAPGDLTAEEMDFVGSFLLQRTKRQERDETDKLHLLYASLRSVTMDTDLATLSSSVREKTAHQKKLVELISTYFADELNQETMAAMGVDSVTHARDLLPEQQEDIARSVRALVTTNSEHRFTGRSVARVFQGIGSPCFPAVAWGGQRQFWRRYLDVDFEELCRIATAKLVQLR